LNSFLARSRAPNYAHTLSDLMPFFCLLPPHSRAPALAHTLSGSLDSFEGPLGGQDSAGALMTSLESQTEQYEEEGKRETGERQRGPAADLRVQGNCEHHSPRTYTIHTPRGFTPCSCQLSPSLRSTPKCHQVLTPHQPQQQQHFDTLPAPAFLPPSLILSRSFTGSVHF
jgi:hypothetical protein